MKPIIKYTLIAVLAVAIAGITIAGVAYAQGDDPPFHGRDGIAELLGLTPEELKEKLQDGATIQELADEAGVDLEAYREEMAQNREENMRTRIEEALDEGLISQEQADWFLEGLDKGFMNGPIFGFGGSRGGPAGGRPGADGFKGPGMRGCEYAE